MARQDIFFYIPHPYTEHTLRSSGIRPGRKAFLFLTFLLCLAFSPTAAFADRTISGRVLDEDGNAIAAALILVRGTQQQTATDSAGYFRLRVTDDRHLTLEATAIGFHAQLRTVDATKGGRLPDFRLATIDRRLKEVEVTAGGTGRLRRSAFNTSVIDTRTLRNSTKSLSDALAAAPGVKVRETGGVGSDLNVSLDGFSGKHVKIFVDGVPQEGVGGALGLNNIPVTMARRIEIYKGVVPVAFGADAIGGVINVVTDTPKKGWTLSGSYAGGSFNTHKATLQWTRNWASGWFVNANAFGNYSDNDYRVLAPVKDLSTGSIDYRRPEWVRRFHDKFHNEAVSLRFGVTNRPWADRLQLGFTAAGLHKDIQTGVRQEIVYGAKYRFGHSLMPSLLFMKNNLWRNRLDVEVTANYNRNASTNVDTSSIAYNWRGEHIALNSPGEQRNMLLRYDDNNWDAGLNLRLRPDTRSLITLHHALTAFDRAATSLLAKEHARAPIDRTTAKNITGLSYLYIPDATWNVTAFAKYYHQLVSGPVSTTDLQDNYVRKHHGQSFLGFGAAATYHILPDLQAKLSYERACRLPNVDELFGDDDLESGSVTLRPEQSHNLNLNLFYTLKSGAHTLAAEAGGIYRDTRDYIQRNVISVGGGRFGASYVNFGRVRTLGANGSLRYTWGWHLSAGVNLTYMDVRDNMPTAQDGVTRNYGYRDRMPNLPYLFGDADVTARFPVGGLHGARLSFTYDTQYLHSFTFYSSRFGANKGDYVVPAQLSHNLSATLAMNRGRYALTLEARNITDRRLYDNFSLQKAGRAFYAKFRFNLGD